MEPDTDSLLENEANTSLWNQIQTMCSRLYRGIFSAVQSSRLYVAFIAGGAGKGTGLLPRA